MRMRRLLGCLGIVTLLTGCYGNSSGISTAAVTTVSTQRIEPTASVTTVPTQQVEAMPTATLPRESQSTAYPPETRMKSQCLDVEPTPVSEIGSNGVLVLKNQGDIHYVRESNEERDE